MLPRITRKLALLVFAVILLTACQPIQPMPADAGPDTSAEDQGDVDAKIQNAMDAAPPFISEGATIIDWPSEPGGEPALLRAGSNDWLCLPDNIGTPGNDPMCVDPIWTSWMNAFMAGTVPEITAPGISYMLAGGSDPSNYDPYATEPQEGEDWVNSGPHIMLLMPGGFDPADFSTDPLSGGPYIMWEGTPYEHLMVPVVPATEAIGPITTSDSDEVKIENIMGSVPQMIGESATFLDWPGEAGGDMTLLREGTNDWTCVPDWPATPANDPMCFDPTYMAWMGAFMGGAEPEVDRLGVSYMLAGGAFADNADPSAMEPPAGQDWVLPAPHVMLVAPDGFDAALFTTDYAWGGPWIVWDETPYEFLVIPIE